MNNQATIKPTTRVSKVWLVPILAILIGAWMLYYQWKNQGPMITIEVSSAAGIEVNKTPIKIRDLDVGQVKKMELKPDLDGVLVSARIDANAAHLLREDTQFWLVSPRITFSEVSGLNTLLSGSYIAMSAAESGGERYHFSALDRPPATPPGTPGLHLQLTSNDEFAFKPGDPIIYKGFKVGEFEDSEFDIESRVVNYRVFIEAPYHQLITVNTRFWNVSGITLSLASSGIEVQTGSLETLLANGITFGIPDGVPRGEKAPNNASFTIFSNREAASDARYTLSARYLLMIDETVRGLTVGAPVEYRGIEIGEVLAINYRGPDDGNILSENYPIPVLIHIYPGKVQQPDTPEGLKFVETTMRKWIAQDLRATLRMGNILTGGLYVDLQHIKDAPASQYASLNGLDVIPTVSNEFNQLTQKADAILDKINRLPLDTLVEDIRQVVADMEDAANSVDEASLSFDELLAGIDSTQINANLNQLLANTDQLVRHYSEGGLSQSEIRDTVNALQDTLRSLQPLLLQLNETPNSLIFSESRQDDLQPKAKTQGIFDDLP
ncbi:MCE family protein [Alteromonas aestuariivivens]|uniref:MCE family protein n=1 Tax=Alteromonas aestuariivivens TaxID=1938339 RepID=A0A3D8M3Y4_9ALTE|nr:intermembrane transport protein PqiB [Alteromonas aestuariivivens]RDV24244.1 MCE family protein [Alteromonas aestuariivivens]